MIDLPLDLDRDPPPSGRTWDRFDFADVRAMPEVVDRIAAGVAARVRLIVLSGPPGIGKTMLARRIPTILPPLDDHQRRWLIAEYEGCGMLQSRGTSRLDRRDFPIPFRAPHHTISTAAMVGSQTTVLEYAGASAWRKPTGRRIPITRAGELGLARFGVLFLDELGEFTLEAIRQLALHHRRMAGAPIVVASVLPCPCGWHGVTAPRDHARECKCSAVAIEACRRRTALYVDTLTRTEVPFASVVPALATTIGVAPINLTDLRNGPAGRNSDELRAEVARAWGAS